MAKIRKRRISWDPSSSDGVLGYKLYWSQNGAVDYDSESAEVGKVTQIALPNDLTLFPLVEGEMEFFMAGCAKRHSQILASGS